MYGTGQIFRRCLMVPSAKMLCTIHGRRRILNAKVPRLERSANFSNASQFNSYYLEDGSFLKMKSLIVGYTFPIAN